MPSPKQIAAARANGAKSRGPVTRQGKLNSSRNGLLHGAFSRAHFIAPEFQEFFNVRLAGFIAELRPQNETEYALAHLAAMLITRFFQLGAAWNRALSLEFEHQRTLNPLADQETLIAAAFEAIHADSSAWLKAYECEQRTLNEFIEIARTINRIARTRSNLAKTAPIQIPGSETEPTNSLKTVETVPEQLQHQSRPRCHGFAVPSHPSPKVKNHLLPGGINTSPVFLFSPGSKVSHHWKEP